MFSEPLKKAAYLLFKRLWYSKRKKKYHQGTVAALDFAPKAGNSVATLKIKYASPQQLSLWGSQSGGRNSTARIMRTRQCLFLLQRFKVVSPMFQFHKMIPKCKRICSNVSTIVVPLIFILFYFPADITQYILRERKAPSISTFWRCRNPLFSENILNGSPLSSGLTTNALYSIFRIAWPTQFCEALTIQLRSQSVLKSNGLCSPKG